jgi:RimJ/RimL family protein N-acetyltransferase
MEITQRNATLADADVLLNWRNNASAREFSLQSELIAMDEHLKWLSGRLERVQFEPFFLFAEDQKVIGMSRLDVVSGQTNKYEISILVDPDQHKKGIGTRILNMTCESFFSLHPNKTIVARVRLNNFVSQKLFTRAGFELQNPVGDFLHFEKSFK